jgi:hypothetical protein
MLYREIKLQHTSLQGNKTAYREKKLQLEVFIALETF